MFSLIRVWINGSVNNREAGDLRCYRAHYDVTVMERLDFVVHYQNLQKQKHNTGIYPVVVQTLTTMIYQ